MSSTLSTAQLYHNVIGYYQSIDREYTNEFSGEILYEWIRNMYGMNDDEVKVYAEAVLLDLLKHREKNIYKRCAEVINACQHLMRKNKYNGVKHIFKEIIKQCNFLKKCNNLLSDVEYKELLLNLPCICDQMPKITERVLTHLANNTIMFAHLRDDSDESEMDDD